MSKRATPIELTEMERQELESVARSRMAPHRSVQRARLVLLAAEGRTNTAIAREVGLSRAMVVQWRQRFAERRMAGLQDELRSGKPPRYDANTERRVLKQLDQEPLDGYTTWTGGLVAKALGDVSKHQVWRVLRKHGIHLQRRRSWCVSTDPQFAQKAATSWACT